MKLATLHNDTRDGQLIVVRRDNERYVPVTAVPTMQKALDNWDEIKPVLRKKSKRLNRRELEGKPLSTDELDAPLPRAYEWIDGSAYINHIVLVRKARGAEPPETLETDPLVYQGGSSNFLRPTGDIPLGDTEWGLDFEAEIAVVLGDTPKGVSTEEAEEYIELVTICNDISLRNLIPDEIAKSFGFLQSKPASTFGPIAVTPDELGDAWKNGRLHRKIRTTYNGEVFGEPHAGPQMHFSFHDLIEHITKTRSYSAGTILGSGTVSNKESDTGSSCLAERRMVEKIETGEFKTPFMSEGDTVQIEVFDDDGNSIFGQIDQEVVRTD